MLGRALSVVVADDEPLIRTILASVLESMGCRVSCASDGEEAWDVLCTAEHDLLITDYMMPRLSGLALIRRIRASSRQLPVIMISGDMPLEEDDFETLLSPGMAIDKPFNAGVLLNAVERLIQPTSLHAGPTDTSLSLSRAS